MSLVNYLEQLYKDYGDNRKILTEKWLKNKRAFDGVIGEDTDQAVGMGNKKSKNEKNNKWRSKTVLNVTRTKVHAAEILVSDVFCSGGELPFTLKESKFIPDGVEKDDLLVPDAGTVPPEYEGLDAVTIFNIEKTKKLNELSVAVEAGLITPEDAQAAGQSILAATMPPRRMSSAEQMTLLIREQLRRADALTVLRKTIFSAAVYGEGVGKMFCKSYKRRGFSQDGTGAWVQADEFTTGIGMKNVSVFDIFTDLENRDIQNNAGVFERSYMSRSEISEMFDRADPLVIGSELDRVIEGHSPDETTVGHAQYKDDDSPEKKMIEKRRRTIEVIEFWGKVPVNLVNEFETQIASSGVSDTACPLSADNGECVEVTAIFTEGHIIKFCRTDGEKRPYFRIDWEEAIDDIAPRSIADIIDTMQQSLNSTLRLYEDNKKLSGNVMFGKKSRFLENKNGANCFYPGNQIDITDECDDVRKALFPLVVPDVGENLLRAIELYRYNANEQSMIPDIAHGVAASSKTTAYEISLQNEKAGKYVSEIVKNIDNRAVIPIVEFFYEWNMYDPDVSNEVKGSYDVEALGFTSYQDRSIRINRINQILSMALSSEALMSMTNLKALYRDAIKAQETDPELYITDDPQLNNLQDIKFAQFQQIVGEQMSGFQQQLDELLKALPSIANKSEAEALVSTARAEKLAADAQETYMKINALKAKMEDNRAKTIANIEKTKRQFVIEDFEKRLEAANAANGAGNEPAPPTAEPQ